jgi:hypothetical protein
MAGKHQIAAIEPDLMTVSNGSILLHHFQSVKFGQKQATTL